MDRIYVFKNGEIIDKGKHEDLIKRDGDYKKIWEIQSTKSIVL
jgi:ATP-binding cassette subfamily B protein